MKYLESLKLWKILFVDESHLLIKMAREETVCDAEIRADAQRINQAASQPAFFILYNIELGKILSICENSYHQFMPSAYQLSGTLKIHLLIKHDIIRAIE